MISQGDQPIELKRLSPALEPLHLRNLGELRKHFLEANWPAPSLLMNFVSDTKGNFVGSSQSSRDITNKFDYECLIGLRMAADGILTTAKTARLEGYRRSRHAPLALVSRSGDFEAIPAVIDVEAGPTDSAVYLLVPSRIASEARMKYSQAWIRVIKIGRGGAFRTTLALTRLGWRRILSESGNKYSRFLIENSAAKFLNLTIVDAGDESPLQACQASLSSLGIRGALLLRAERVEDTLFTQWSEFL